MPEATDERLLEILLESWDRNNAILVNLHRALPESGLENRVMSELTASNGSPSRIPFAWRDSTVRTAMNP